jgi:4-hydroxy-tetrahydrodipicolinate reductase
MGRQVCRAVASDESLSLVAAVDPGGEGTSLADIIGEELAASPAAGEDIAGTRVVGSPDAIAAGGAEVAVDFTVAASAVANMRWCASNGVHAVVGTTGIDDETLDEMGGLFARSEANCVVAANFAIGAVLMEHFSAMAARFMQGAEIVELHHDGKLDAPSGTAIATAEAIRAAAGPALDIPATLDASPASGVLGERAGQRGTHRGQELLAGARGAEGAGGVRIHSVRLPGLVAHQEVIFGAPGQSLTIRHDAYDRSSFMPGVLLAVKSVGSFPGLTRGLAPLIGL